MKIKIKTLRRENKRCKIDEILYDFYRGIYTRREPVAVKIKEAAEQIMRLI